jgi:hypothetical protein
MADIETTVSPPSDMLVEAALKLSAAAKGVIYDTSTTLSGAVGNIDFSNRTILRYTVTGNLSGAFTWPPINYPALAADGQSVVLSIAFIQDATGGRVISLDDLFANAGPENIFGISLVDEAPNGVTAVDIVARRASGVVSYTVLFSPGIDAGQIVTGTIPVGILPTATSSSSGVVTLASGSGAAAAGNHTHAVPLPSRITLESNGAAIPTGVYELLDMPTSGTIVRLTGALLTGTGSPAATLTLRIAGVDVTGTGTSANGVSASADANATAANTFVARQKVQLNMTVTAGTVTMVSAYMHYTLNSNAWAG